MAQTQTEKSKLPEALESRQPQNEPHEIGPQPLLLSLQRTAGNRAVVGLLESRGWLQTKLLSDAPADEFEDETDIAAQHALQFSTAPTGVVQRKCATCTPTSKCSECEEEELGVQRKPKNSSVLLSTTPHIQRAPRHGNSDGAATPDTAAEPESAISTAGPLIVEDDAATVAPGQMRKSEFLEQLRSTVCTTADEALAEAGQSTEGCPYIEQWFSHYADKPPAHIEGALRKYAPGANSATSAREYIPAVSNRVRQGIAIWARTGELTGVPEELQSMLSGTGAALGAIGGMLSSIGSAIGGAITAAAGAIGGAFSSIGRALFKRKEGQDRANARATNDAGEIQQQLSGGRPLDSGAKSRMGGAFGHDFSNVRVHTNSEAAGLSESLNARAFTIGSDIAFGAGEYQPGTMIGDALIAHELAHVVQQSGGGNGSPPQSKGDAGHDALEEEADVSAVGAVSKLWLSAQGALAEIGKQAMPRLRSGLQLQRCPRRREVPNAQAGQTPETEAAIRAAAEGLVDIGGTAEDSDRAPVVEELIKIPLAALLALGTKGVRVVVCRNSVTEIREDLRGVHPRNWPEGTTWDTVPGLNDPNSNRVIIAVRNGRVPPAGEGHGGYNLVLHEVGHAIGDAMASGGVADARFIAARDLDLALLDSYEGAPGNPGVRETYAESFARFYGNDPADARTYPNLHAYWASNPFVIEAR